MIPYTLLKMSVLNHLVSNTLKSSKLALFICHLFVSGHFRFGHILYDPKVFNSDLITEIYANCSVQIPWQTTDISQSSPLPWRVSERTDHILQLIFFDPTNFVEKPHQFHEYFAFYRIFIFPSTLNEIEMKQQMAIIAHLNPILKSSPLILYYGLQNQSLNVYSTTGTKLSSDSEKNVDLNLTFDETFGKCDNIQSMAIQSPMLFWKKEDFTNYKSRIPHLGHIYNANYYSASLNASYINVTCSVYNVTTSPESYMVTHRPSKYYKELALEYEPIENDRM